MCAGSRPSGPNASGAQTASRAKKAKFQKTAQRPMPRSSSWRTTKRAPAWMEATKEDGGAEGGEGIAPGRRQQLGEQARDEGRRQAHDGARQLQTGIGARQVGRRH